MRNILRRTAVIAIAAGVAAMAAGSAPDALAGGNKTATFDVSLTVKDDCSVSASPLNFGTTGVIENNIDQNTSLAISCSKGTAYSVALDPGTAADSSVVARKMASGSGDGSVDFNLYRDAGRKQIWGQVTGTDTVSGTGSSGTQTLTVYGRVPVQTMPATGNYSSTITATVVF